MRLLVGIIREEFSSSHASDLCALHESMVLFDPFRYLKETWFVYHFDPLFNGNQNDCF